MGHIHSRNDHPWSTLIHGHLANLPWSRLHQHSTVAQRGHSPSPVARSSNAIFLPVTPHYFPNLQVRHSTLFPQSPSHNTLLPQSPGRSQHIISPISRSNRLALPMRILIHNYGASFAIFSYNFVWTNFIHFLFWMLRTYVYRPKGLHTKNSILTTNVLNDRTCRTT